MLRVWLSPRSIAAGLCGSVAHALLLYGKSRSGILPSFQPYERFQMVLSQWVGSDVHPLVPWALSFLNGSIVLSFAFAQFYRRIPGSNSAVKGAIFAVLGWVVMGLIFFPLLGMGVFAAQIGLGIGPAVFSFAMLLTYSIVMDVVYSALDPAAVRRQRQ
ncbi:MAG: hypothetical protein NTV56_21650 [Alphaproteobacteria bacterium]|nr:hypothetical protein [Alphaproteobacteria bacterium]